MYRTLLIIISRVVKPTASDNNDYVVSARETRPTVADDPSVLLARAKTTLVAWLEVTTFYAEPSSPSPNVGRVRAIAGTHKNYVRFVLTLAHADKKRDRKLCDSKRNQRKKIANNRTPCTYRYHTIMSFLFISIFFF